MKERPILFNGEMVLAILEGRKTQTRRAVKWADHSADSADIEEYPDYPGEWFQWKDGEKPKTQFCPYGKVGDRLWVRETWANALDNPVMGSDGEVAYRATDPDWSYCEGFRWRPSIHMPRWASRITLEITEVRVERVQDITDEDAMREGIDDAWLVREKLPSDGRVYSFRHLWDSINESRGFGWQSNPWVWVVSFERVRDAE